jgi:hypothetical protein
MRFLSLRFPYIVAGAVCAAALAGCDGNGVKVGPFPVSVDLGAGSFSAEAAGVPAGTKGTTTFDYPLCELPTEEDLNELARENVESNFSRLVSLSEILVQDVTILATQGNFEGLTAIAVFYVPAPVLGIPQLPVALGSAASIGGFDVEVNLEPLNEVDLLELVRDNDANLTDDCPTLTVVVTGEVPEIPIGWQATIMADVYGVLGF